MAEGFLRRLAGDHFEVFSAGTKPVGLNPNAVTATWSLASTFRIIVRNRWMSSWASSSIS
jgi:hypothetical protein